MSWARTRAVDLAAASILVLLLYAIIRRSPRRWWLAVWVGFLANTTLAGYLRVRTFESTAKSMEPVGWRYPEVVADMESVARNAGAIIPPGRLVELHPFGLGRPGYQPEFAAATPIGTPQRIIFAEQLIDDTSRPEILFVFGHEMGHLVLHHDAKNRLLDALILLVLASSSFRACGWVLSRWGPGWGITAMSDLASLPLLLVMLVALNFAKLPGVQHDESLFRARGGSVRIGSDPWHCSRPWRRRGWRVRAVRPEVRTRCEPRRPDWASGSESIPLKPSARSSRSRTIRGLTGTSHDMCSRPRRTVRDLGPVHMGRLARCINDAAYHLEARRRRPPSTAQIRSPARIFDRGPVPGMRVWLRQSGVC